MAQQTVESRSGRIDPSALVHFIDSLRDAGFNVDTTHHIAAQDLVLALTARHGPAATDAEPLKRLLRPLLCSSAAEQHAFDRYFEAWADRLFPAPADSSPAPLPPEEPDPPSTLQDELQRFSRQRSRWGWALGGLGALAFTLAVYLALRPPTPETGTVRFSTDPAGATVYLLARDSLGTSGWRVADTLGMVWAGAPADTHRVRVRWEAYKGTLDTTIAVRAGTSGEAPTAYAFALDFGRLDVGSQPEGATVSLDGERVGMTSGDRPLQIDSVVVGTHRLRFTKDGFVPFDTMVVVDTASVATVDIPLARIRYGQIEVVARREDGGSFSEGDGAVVFVDGDRAGVTPGDEPLEIDSVAVGTRRLRLTKDGFASFDTTVVVGETAAGDSGSDTSRYTFALRQQRYGSLAVESQPEGATVFLNGDSLGVTQGDRPLRIDSLLVESYEIRIVAEGLEPFITTVSVAANEERSLRSELVPKQRSVFNVAFRPDGRSIVTGSPDSDIVVWDLDTQQATDTLAGSDMRWTRRVTQPGSDQELSYASSYASLEGHYSAVLSVAFSPDGSRLAIASADGTAGLLDTDTGAPLANLVLRHEAEMWTVAFSPDGTGLASGSSDGTVRLWDPTDPTANPAVLIAHERGVTSVAFSPDGERLASGSSDRTVRLWDPTDPEAEPVVLTGHGASVTSVAFSPDGERLASASVDRTVRLWDPDDPEAEPVVLIGHENLVTSVAFSPDGQRLASGSSDGTVRLWDLADPAAEPEVLSGHESAVNSVAFSPDGTGLASAGGDGTVRLWDPDDPDAEPVVLTGHENLVTSVAFSPDGQRLASGSSDGTFRDGSSNGTVRLWLTRQSHPWYQRLVQDVAFNADSTQIAHVSEDGDVVLRHARTRTVIKRLEHQSPALSVAFNPNGSGLVSASTDGTVRAWTSTPSVHATLTGHGGRVTSVAFSPDSARLASASVDGTVRLWDPADPAAEPVVLTGHGASVTSVAFSPDGQRLASAGGNGTVRLWDPADPTADPVVLTGHEGAVLSVAFSPGGERLASASYDGTVRLWDPTDPDADPVVLTGHGASVTSVAFSPDGERLASASVDRTVRLWDPDDPEAEPVVLYGREGVVTSVAFSPDGTRLASGSWDGTIRLWDPADPTAEPVVLSGREFDGLPVAFSPDGERLASAWGDGTVRLWDPTDPDADGVVLTGHEGAVTSVAFSPDGEHLASASHDNTVHLWDVDFDRLAGTRLGEVRSVTYDPEGTRFASAGEDGAVVIWNAETVVPVDSMIFWTTGSTPGDSVRSPVQSVAYSPDGTRLAAANADSTVTVWQVASRTATLRGWMLGWPGVLLAVAAAMGGLWGIVRRHQASQFLTRHATDEEPHLEYVRLARLASHLFPENELFHVARRLRRRVEASSQRLDLPGTVAETIHRAGLFTPVFRTDTRIPEYLALVDRTTPSDQQARLFDDLLDQLEANEVFVVRYYFDGDPRICFPRSAYEKPVDLPTLTSRYPDHHLLLFTDVSNLLSSVTGAYEAWTELLKRWPERALLTPEHSSVNQHQSYLSDLIPVFPATPDGLVQIAAEIDEGSSEAPNSDAPRYPSMIRWQPERWIERDPPRPDQVEDLMKALRTYLGADGVYWMAACSIYPALHWTLTLNLGHALRASDGTPLLTVSRLTALARLPWFRHGYMPDWFRLRLLAELTPEREQEVRVTLEALLVSAVRGDATLSDLEIARQKSGFFDSFARNLLRRLRKRVPSTHPLRDYVFLDFMAGRQPDRLAVRVPRALTRLVGGGTSSLPPRLAADARRLGVVIPCVALLLVALPFGANQLWQALPPSPMESAERLFVMVPGPPQVGTITLRVLPMGTVSIAAGQSRTVGIYGQSSQNSGTFTAPAGRQAITCEHPRYGAFNETVTIRAGEETSATCYFEATVTVTSVLESGERVTGSIWVDDFNTGRATPTQIKLGVGTHTINVQKDGFQTIDRTVTIRPSLEEQTERVEFRLRKVDGK